MSHPHGVATVMKSFTTGSLTHCQQAPEQHRCVCVCVYLQDGHLIAQLTLLFGGEAEFVYDLDGDVSAGLPVFTCGKPSQTKPQSFLFMI